MPSFIASSSNQISGFPVVLQSLTPKLYRQFYGFQNYNEAFSFSNTNSSMCLCEHMQFQDALNPFFDIDKEIPRGTDYDFSIQYYLDLISNQISRVFGDNVKPFFFVKEACGDLRKNNQDLYKFSYHVILRLFYNDFTFLTLSNKYEQQLFLHFLQLPSPPFDSVAYSGFNLRLLNQDKYDTKSNCLYKRILKKSSQYTSHFSPNDDLESFASYFPVSDTLSINDFLQCRFVLHQIRQLNYLKDYNFGHFTNDDRTSPRSIYLELTEQRCPHRTHHSNNSFASLYINFKREQEIGKNKKSVVYDENSPIPISAQRKVYLPGSNFLVKCLDKECGAFLHFKIDHTKLPFQFVLLNNPEVKFPGDSTEQSPAVVTGYPVEQRDLQDTIYKTGKDIYIKSGSVAKECQNIGPNGFRMACQLAPLFNNEQQYEFFSENGVCKNNYNDYSYPIDANVLNALKLLKQEYSWDELKQLNIHIGDVNNYITTNNNYYGTQKEDDNQPIDDPKQQNDILSFISSPEEKKYVELLLRKRMQFITHLYNLLKPNDFIYIPNQKKDKNIFYFTNIIKNKQTNGGYWTNEDGSREFRRRIRDEIQLYFDNLIKKIRLADEKSKFPKLLEKFTEYISNIIEKQGTMEQYAMETFKDTSIKFNSNRHLIHFINGTFDLEERQFVQTTPDMLNTQMITYDYNSKQPYDIIESVIQQIIGNNNIYPWFIKQLSYCLHPDQTLEQKQIIILTGQGNNGKTLLMNLVLNTFDEDAYGVTGRPLMIQASTEQLSAATPDLVTLIDKRFCYFPELESSKQLNQTQIKQLTGGDRIKGRGLYADLESFEPYAGLFVSCNQMPDINTSDSGFLNRIKIIELKRQFVDDPQHQFHLPKDKNLVSKVKTKKWKQGFMNMLIDKFYNDHINIPQEVLYQIQSRINMSQDPFYIWADDNLQYSPDSFIIPEQIRLLYNDSGENYTINSSKGILKKLFQYFQINIQNFPNVIQKRDPLPQHLAKQFGKRPNTFYNVRLKLSVEI